MVEIEQKPGEGLIAAEKSAVPHIGFAARLRNYFLTGLVVAGPLAVTTWLIWSFINWVDDLIRPFIPPAYRPESYLPWPIPGTGLIIALLSLTLLGFLTANLVGRSLVELGESLLNRMPIVRPIYNTMKQIFEALFSKTGSSFRKVALVEFPAPGMWSLVFLSQPPGRDLAARMPQGEHVSAFMPCTPNPTTGFFFYVPKSKIIEVEMNAEDAATLIMSCGVVQPGSDQQKKIAALAGMANAARVANSSMLQPEPAKAE